MGGTSVWELRPLPVGQWALFGVTGERVFDLSPVGAAGVNGSWHSALGVSSLLHRSLPHHHPDFCSQHWHVPPKEPSLPPVLHRG